jgi:hypothetical protein
VTRILALSLWQAKLGQSKLLSFPKRQVTTFKETVPSWVAYDRQVSVRARVDAIPSVFEEISAYLSILQPARPPLHLLHSPLLA